MRRNKRFATMLFPFLSYSYSRFLPGLTRKDARTNLLDPRGKTKKRKIKIKEKKRRNGKVLFTALRNGKCLLLKYAPPIESAASYAYIDLPARHSVNIHGGYRKNRHRAFSKFWTSGRRKQTPRAFSIPCFPSGGNCNFKCVNN